MLQVNLSDNLSMYLSRNIASPLVEYILFVNSILLMLGQLRTITSMQVQLVTKDANISNSPQVLSIKSYYNLFMFSFVR